MYFVYTKIECVTQKSKGKWNLSVNKKADNILG